MENKDEAVFLMAVFTVVIVALAAALGWEVLKLYLIAKWIAAGVLS